MQTQRRLEAMGEIDSYCLPSNALVLNSLIANIRLSKKLVLRNRVLLGELRQIRLEIQMNLKRSERLLNQSRIVSAEHKQHGGQALEVLATVARLVCLRTVRLL
jgi:hypothetical protein